ncbi:MAG: DUF4157 domain-containing protein [Pyrinomonadaceae bacterium]|nr:DUF4157 domain-containing protein [Pyrinomonadaceae bacterium]
MAKSTITGLVPFSQGREVSSILRLQRSIGNQAVQRLPQTDAEQGEMNAASRASPRFAHNFCRISVYPKAHTESQPKLTVSTPGEIYEQEADRVADQVMRMPDPRVQRQAEEAEEKMPQAKRTSGQTNELAAGVRTRINAIQGAGEPLPDSERAFFEPRFGHDFGQVRVHTNDSAARAAKAIHARAFTYGNHVFFGAGEYSPNTATGQHLFAHELTHVVQQQAAPGLIQRQDDPKLPPGADRAQAGISGDSSDRGWLEERDRSQDGPRVHRHESRCWPGRRLESRTGAHRRIAGSARRSHRRLQLGWLERLGTSW